MYAIDFVENIWLMKLDRSFENQGLENIALNSLTTLIASSPGGAVPATIIDAGYLVLTASGYPDRYSPGIAPRVFGFVARPDQARVGVPRKTSKR
jgi:hypothetical protein